MNGILKEGRKEGRWRSLSLSSIKKIDEMKEQDG
jgi:hypothetical protein